MTTENRSEQSLSDDGTKISSASQNLIIYFSIPKTETPICTAEIKEIYKRKSEFFQLRSQFVFTNHEEQPKFIEWFEQSAGSFKGFLFRRTVNNTYFRQILIKQQKEIIYQALQPNNVGRNIKDLLRIVDGIKTGENCICNES